MRMERSRSLWDYPGLLGGLLLMVGLGIIATTVAAALGADPVIAGALAVGVILVVFGLLFLGTVTDDDSTNGEAK